MGILRLPRPSRRVLLLGIAPLLPAAVPATAPAQEASVGVRSGTMAGAGLRRARAVPVEERDRVRLDGVLDEATWRGAPWISDLRQKEPDQGAEPTLRTEVAFLYDDVALYVGARLESDDPVGAVGLLTRRDEAGVADRIVVSFDTFRDGRTAYGFGVTAAGARLDWFHPEDREESRDPSFDPVWEAKTRAGTHGWTAELRIPFSQLRFLAGSRAWGLNVSRFVPSRNEEAQWVLVPRDETGWASRFGTLEGFRALRPGRPLELLPFAVLETEVTSPGRIRPGDPFTERVEPRFRAGLDLKLGLGPNLTLDGAVNPDFGQVEFDPAVVNLSAFETVFEERRPFFTEGNPLLSGGSGPRFFFSRRIGAVPHGQAPTEFAAPPEAVTILGAAKLTGRLRSGLSVGVLGAATGAESARTFDAVADTFGRVPVEPAAAWGAIRLQQEFGPSASTAGVTGTAVLRDLEPGDDLSAFLAARALTGKADWNLRLRNGAWELAGHAGFSLVEGDTAAMRRIQLSSAHYFQRPDQAHVRFEPSRTSLAGWTAGFGLSKNAGGWLIRTGLRGDSPGLDLNDVGQIFRGDAALGWLDIGYRQTDPGPVLRNWSVTLLSRAGWNFGGIRRMNRLGVEAEATWPNFMLTRVETSWLPATLSDDLTRGGPLMRRPSDWTATVAIESDPSASVRGSASVFRGNRSFSPDWIFRSSLAIDPSARWRLSLEPRHLRLANALQYVTALEGGPAATFGRRYVFATARVREIALPFRAAYAFTPDLSLDLVAEPFAATGSFTRFGELAAARTSRLRVYGTDGTSVAEVRTPEGGRRLMVTDGDRTFQVPDPDFRRLSFRTSLVLRWEWLPGSTLFLVWQGNRSAVEASDDFVGLSALGDAVTAPGSDAFIVKVSHWLPV